MEVSRFDALARSLAVVAPRRRLLRLLAGLGLGGALLGRRPRPVAARRVICPECPPPPSGGCPRGTCWCDSCSCACLAECCSAGVFGAGRVRLERGGEADLLLLATRSGAPTEDEAGRIAGRVRWHDPGWEGAGLTLEAVSLTAYGPTPNVGGGREAYGWVAADRVPDRLPFALRVVAAEGGGGDRDRVALLVGDAALEDPAVAADPPPGVAPSGFRYAATGSLVAGGLGLFLVGPDAAGAPAAGTPPP